MLRFLLITVAILIAILALGVFWAYRTFSEGHRVRGDKLYWNGGWPRYENFLSEIDGKSIKLLRDGFAKDKQIVYYKTSKLETAHAPTFGVLDGGFAKDKYRVYHYSLLIEQADPATFDIKTFTDLNGNQQIYGIDKKHVYYQSYKFSDDPKNFTILGGWYSKDAQHVYFEHFKIDEADLPTFQVKALERYDDLLILGVDKNNVYKGTDILSSKPHEFNWMVEY